MTTSDVPSPFRVCGRVLRAFDSMLVQPLKTWMRLEREVSLLRDMDYLELQDIGIYRMDIDAIRAGTYNRASSDDTERIVWGSVAGGAKPPRPEHPVRQLTV